MKNTVNFAQLYLRLALGIGFLSAVADRIGWLGPKGYLNVSWGNWDNFVSYTSVLMPYLGHSGANVMGLLATMAEAIFGIQLIIGYQTRLAAFGSFLLVLTFALSMSVFMGFQPPLSYSVYTASAGSLLLGTVATYTWSLDNYFNKASKTE